MMQSQDIGLVLVALIGLVGTIWGGRAGRDKLTGRAASLQKPDGDTVEIRGAIVSDRAVEKMVASFDALTAAVGRDVEAKTKLTAALARNSDVSEDMHEQIKDTGSKLERLKDEFIRAGIRARD